MHAKGHYHELYTRQFEEEAEEEVLGVHEHTEAVSTG
jgi:hypothetical protein